MAFDLLETVVLDRDLPDHGLRKGDLGAVVHIHDSGELEVEFVTAAGRTEALVSLSPSDLRRVGDRDLVAVRRLRRSA
jgi:prolyl-tRNA editing enzyme YbaK/EbsC (Cys-tRNA(Pro) deacylase)